MTWKQCTVKKIFSKRFHAKFYPEKLSKCATRSAITATGTQEKKRYVENGGRFSKCKLVSFVNIAYKSRQTDEVFNFLLEMKRRVIEKGFNNG